jgi:hypothetical protein
MGDPSQASPANVTPPSLAVCWRASPSTFSGLSLMTGSAQSRSPLAKYGPATQNSVSIITFLWQACHIGRRSPSNDFQTTDHRKRSSQYLPTYDILAMYSMISVTQNRRGRSGVIRISSPLLVVAEDLFEKPILRIKHNKGVAFVAVTPAHANSLTEFVGVFRDYHHLCNESTNLFRSGRAIKLAG